MARELRKIIRIDEKKCNGADCAPQPATKAQ